MGSEIIKDRMTFIMQGNDLNRLQIYESEKGTVIKIDLHGMKCGEAFKVINSILLLCRFRFTLDIIHGYNRGTNLKEMIYHQLMNSRIISKHCDVWNPGETIIEIS